MSKKRWAWKEKHVRKYQARKSFMWGQPPKDFRKPYHRGNRAKERMDLRKVEMGFEEIDFSPKNHNRSAAWDWW